MTKSATKIAVLYSLFVGLSAGVNIGSQMLSMPVYSRLYAVEISIYIGALAGASLRNFLEKIYIFSFQSKNIKNDGQLFALYSCIGVILGLTIGYCIKYQLDIRLVFVDKSEKVVAI